MKQREKLAAQRAAKTITLTTHHGERRYSHETFTAGQLRDKLATLHREALASRNYWEYMHICRYERYEEALYRLVNEYRGRISARILGRGRQEVDEYGDAGTNYYVVKSKEEPGLTLLEELGLYRTWCEHSYDCCGHIYFSNPRVEKHLKRDEWLVRQSWHRNV